MGIVSFGGAVYRAGLQHKIFAIFNNADNIKPTDAIRVAVSPRIGVGPGFDSQGSVNFFTKYCFPNLH